MHTLICDVDLELSSPDVSGSCARVTQDQAHPSLLSQHESTAIAREQPGASVLKSEGQTGSVHI